MIRTVLFGRHEEKKKDASLEMFQKSDKNRATDFG